jgi:hypothetical protein
MTYLWVMGMALSAGFILLADYHIYAQFAQEDHLIENLTAVLLFLAGFTLVKGVRGWSRMNHVFKLSEWVLRFAGLILLWAALEEISWGQRIVGWETPDWMKEVNDQDETNLHNTNKLFFDRLLDRLTILLVIVSAYFRLRGIRTFWHIPLADTWLICAFAVSPFYIQYNSKLPDFFQLQYLPLIALAVGMWKEGERQKFYAVVGTIFLSLLVAFLHLKLQYRFVSDENSVNEFRELFFATATFGYALFISGRRLQFVRGLTKRKVQSVVLSE